MRIVPTKLLFWADGMALTPNLIFVKFGYVYHAGLIAHEREHCRQMKEVGTVKFWFKYLFNRGFRLQMELKGYAVQLKYQPYNLDAFANSIATKYFLNIPASVVKILLIMEGAKSSHTV